MSWWRSEKWLETIYGFIRIVYISHSLFIYFENDIYQSSYISHDGPQNVLNEKANIPWMKMKNYELLSDF
jgi:hypothetical protein